MKNRRTLFKKPQGVWYLKGSNVDISSLTDSQITVTYADQKNASGVAENITQTFTKTQLGENELAGELQDVLGVAKRVVVKIPTGTTLEDITSVTVDGTTLDATKYNVQPSGLVIADTTNSFTAATVIKVTISGTEYTVKF